MIFAQSVKGMPVEFGSRKHYKRVENFADKYELTTREGTCIESRDGFYISSVDEIGWPYIQHIGGPKGFLKVIDSQTLGMAEYRESGQYISTDNLNTSVKAMLYLMDYPTRSRLKVLVEMEVVSVKGNEVLGKKLVNGKYGAKFERLLLFHVKSFDWKYNQHITPRFTLEEFNNFSKNTIKKKII